MSNVPSGETDDLLSQVAALDAREAEALRTVEPDESILGMLDSGEIQSLCAAVAKRTQRSSSIARIWRAPGSAARSAWGALAVAATLILAIGLGIRSPSESRPLPLPEYTLVAAESDATDRAASADSIGLGDSEATAQPSRSYTIGRRLQFVLRTATRTELDVQAWLFSRSAPETPIVGVDTREAGGGTLLLGLQTGPGAYQPRAGADELVVLVGHRNAPPPSREIVTSTQAPSEFRRFRIPVVWSAPVP